MTILTYHLLLSQKLSLAFSKEKINTIYKKKLLTIFGLRIFFIAYNFYSILDCRRWNQNFVAEASFSKHVLHKS
ncbi:hypothetical protein BpHYR1_016252 [Brachionus plicatilis]|uniref:Uncharacterized protein n=1 Tax=Brachionus plicatilis TaxID=10195 RepID=A0A3M7RIC4_BRAPC|nr:hypothetical protein BpHYR1_016252 [Brachionus plicatilis]